MRLRRVALLTAVLVLAALNVMAARGSERTVTVTTTEVVEAGGPAESANGTSAVPVANDLVQQGRNLFSAKGCASCHVEIQAGPSLSNLKDRAAKTKQGFSAEQYVRESILAPSAFRAPGGGGVSGDMPTLPVSAAELNALVAYLLTL